MIAGCGTLYHLSPLKLATNGTTLTLLRALPINCKSCCTTDTHAIHFVGLAGSAGTIVPTVNAAPALVTHPVALIEYPVWFVSQ